MLFAKAPALVDSLPIAESIGPAQVNQEIGLAVGYIRITTSDIRKEATA
jgi:uncharacterized membrane protein YGL010W